MANNKPKLEVSSLPTVLEASPKTSAAVSIGKVTIPENEIPDFSNKPGKDNTLELMKAALTKVEEVLTKADQTVTMLQQNLTQVTNQKIGLSYQKAMLLDLIGVVEKTNKK